MRENSQKIKELLDKVGKIVDEDEKIQQERELKGEKFNLFNVLGLWSDEVRLHSAFIAELLNPKGKHGLKARFLKAFIQIINSECNTDKIEFDVEKTYVEIEKYIGNVDTTKAEGGRIDILISDEAKAIIIENKINAEDTHQQLMRYANYAKKNYPENFKILYLTLNGTEASEGSAGKEGKEVSYLRISYRDNILKWLERCLEIAVRHPLVRESINQYITLIKQLTNQNMENEIRENLAELLCEKENFLSAIHIANNINYSKQYIFRKIFRKILEKKLKEHRIIFSPTCNVLKKWNLLFEIHPIGWKHFRICFEFDSDNARNCYVGIITNGNQNNESKIKIREIAKSLNQYWSTDGWDILKWFEIKSWGDREFLMMFDEESDLHKKIIEAVNTFIEMTNEIDM